MKVPAVPSLRVSILDANNVTVAGIQASLAGDTRFRVVASSTTVQDTTRLRRRLGANDLVVVDPTVLGEPVLGCLPALFAAGFNVLVYTDFFEADFFFDALLSGARGYILKSATDAERLKDLMWAVARRDALIVDGSLARHFWASPSERVVLFAPSNGITSITPRQRQIVDLLARGHTDGEIALELGVSLSTVQSHILNMERSLGANNRFALAIRAVKAGLINPSGAATSLD